MIRMSEQKDIPEIMEIWLSSNLSAHPFVEEEFWRSHYDEVAFAMENGVTVYVEAGKVVGFIGLLGNYVAGLFVKDSMRGRGIGKALMDYEKSHNSMLTLDVFALNERAVSFYKREGFKICSSKVNPEYGCEEYRMEWIG